MLEMLLGHCPRSRVGIFYCTQNFLANSALSYSSKRTILTQECLRRLRNTKIERGPEVQKMHLDQFMLKLKNSGYSKNSDKRSWTVD